MRVECGVSGLVNEFRGAAGHFPESFYALQPKVL
jgi:hypothetical protein